jgi:hypothetical protein
VTLIELPRARRAPRVFVETPPGPQRTVTRALNALGDLPEGFDLPGLDALSGALIALADEIDGDTDFEHDADLEPDPDDADACDLPLFSFPARAPP